MPILLRPSRQAASSFSEVKSVVHDPLRNDLGARGDLPAPAEPNAGFLLEHRLDGDFKPAGARLRIFLGNGDTVGNDDKLLSATLTGFIE
jgi:hypothetical protein